MEICWTIATALGLVLSTARMIDSLRHQRFGVDIIAVLALVGAIVVDEPFAGAMITLMLVTGRLLESRATQRARRDLSPLVQRAPRTARRVEPAGTVEIPVDQVRRGDHLLVGPGELVPVDGRLPGSAVLDETSLTGESLDRSAG